MGNMLPNANALSTAQHDLFICLGIPSPRRYLSLWKIHTSAYQMNVAGKSRVFEHIIQSLRFKFRFLGAKHIANLNNPMPNFLEGVGELGMEGQNVFWALIALPTFIPSLLEYTCPVSTQFPLSPLLVHY
ncbi:hypothetical protein M413DRAFT_29570 [Hebeloma cylindrosporum]|uniref:Uncharacterized protein n=1 Tax=Hebeloma cylindrosporum TaxID=76867 RepID=A0A0C3BQQ3_HEBCY|nr:hypothetical protein M413DRAFT_29570 [Hebeloma cylindrosporum h7]